MGSLYKQSLDNNNNNNNNNNSKIKYIVHIQQLYVLYKILH